MLSHTLDRAESDFDEVIDVSYFYYLFSQLCPTIMHVEVFGSRSPISVLWQFGVHFESGGGYNRSGNRRYWLRIISIFSFDAKPLL